MFGKKKKKEEPAYVPKPASVSVRHKYVHNNGVLDREEFVIDAYRLNRYGLSFMAPLSDTISLSRQEMTDLKTLLEKYEIPPVPPNVPGKEKP